MTGDIPTADALPDALVDTPQWVCWQSQEREGKQTKVPIDPATGEYASSTDPTTWGTFETAQTSDGTAETTGMGFVFTDDDAFVGVDLDDCRDPDSGTAAEWASDIIERLDSYTEISPSGTGYHVLVQGSLPDGRNRHGDVELYETARFFTVTGAYVGGQRSIQERTDALAAVHADHVSQQAAVTGRDDEKGQDAPLAADEPQSGGEPTGVNLSDEALLKKARNAANGEKFEQLWEGDISGYESHSEADMALCCLLAFWTGGDQHRIDRLFRDSRLLREK